MNFWCIWCNAFIKSRHKAAPHLRLKYFVCLFCQNFDCIQDRNVVNYAIFTIFYCLHLQQTIPWGSGLKQFRRNPCIYKATKWGQSFKKTEDPSLLEGRKYRASDYILQPFTTMATSLYIQIFSSGRHTLQTHTERKNGHLTSLQHSTPPLETLGMYLYIFLL